MKCTLYVSVCAQPCKHVTLEKGRCVLYIYIGSLIIISNFVPSSLFFNIVAKKKGKKMPLSALSHSDSRLDGKSIYSHCSTV